MTSFKLDEKEEKRKRRWGGGGVDLGPQGDMNKKNNHERVQFATGHN